MVCRGREARGRVLLWRRVHDLGLRLDDIHDFFPARIDALAENTLPMFIEFFAARRMMGALDRGIGA
jgi:hypothetical protein